MIGGGNAAIAQGANRALGLQSNFSWTQVAAASLTQGAGSALGLQDVLNQIPGDAAGITQGTLSGTVFGSLNRAIVVALDGHGKIDFANIAADSFGNALGNSIVGAVQQLHQNQIKQQFGSLDEGQQQLVRAMMQRNPNLPPEVAIARVQAGFGNPNLGMNETDPNTRALQIELDNSAFSGAQLTQTALVPGAPRRTDLAGQEFGNWFFYNDDGYLDDGVTYMGGRGPAPYSDDLQLIPLDPNGTGADFGAENVLENGGGQSVSGGITFSDPLTQGKDAILDWFAGNGGAAGTKNNTALRIANGVGYVAADILIPGSVAELAIGAAIGPIVGKGFHLATAGAKRWWPFLGENVSGVFQRITQTPRRSSGKIEGNPNVVEAATNSVESFSSKTAFDGKLYPTEKLQQLVSYLERRNVSVWGTEGNPKFVGKWDGSGEMYLPENPTELQVKHELSHYLDFRNSISDAADTREGVQAFIDMGRLGREESVLNRLQNNRIWDQLNDNERSFSVNYVEDLRQGTGQ